MGLNLKIHILSGRMTIVKNLQFISAHFDTLLKSIEKF